MKAKFSKGNTVSFGAGHFLIVDIDPAAFRFGELVPATYLLLNVSKDDSVCCDLYWWRKGQYVIRYVSRVDALGIFTTPDGRCEICEVYPGAGCSCWKRVRHDFDKQTIQDMDRAHEKIEAHIDAIEAIGADSEVLKLREDNRVMLAALKTMKTVMLCKCAVGVSSHDDGCAVKFISDVIKMVERVSSHIPFDPDTMVAIKAEDLPAGKRKP